MAINIGAVLQQWGDWGVYTYLLPALLIFAVIFGILTSTNMLGKSKGVHVIVALVISIISVVGLNQYVGNFFQEIFPRLGVGLAIIVTLVILTSLFIHEDNTKYWMWGISAVGVIIWIVATSQSFQAMAGGFSIGSMSGEDLAALVIGGVLIIGVIIAVAASGGSSEKPK